MSLFAIFAMIAIICTEACGEIRPGGQSAVHQEKVPRGAAQALWVLLLPREKDQERRGQRRASADVAPAGDQRGECT